MRLETDNADYHVLKNAVSAIKGVPGMLCEIGTRRGGSLAHIINTLGEMEDFGRNIVFIDPYGNIEYAQKDGVVRQRTDYTNLMRNETLSALYYHVGKHPVNPVPMIMEDTEFFKRFADGVPFYHEHKVIETQYALVFFDGPHDVTSVMKEIDFFHSRSAPGAMWVFDDVVGYYDHDFIEKMIEKLGWKLVEKTDRKASYKLGG
jgi:cephalosporin hydroxylase